MSSTERALVCRVRVANVERSKCPFVSSGMSFELREGGLVWLRGPSGSGKSTIGAAVCGLKSRRELRRLGLEVEVEWVGERSCGALFQSTTLLDALSVEANVCLALEAAGAATGDLRGESKRLLQAVGLDYARDGCKAVSALSGGMARRASLALQLAQRKRVVVLDEPFAGLDASSALAVAAEMRRLSTAFLLIEHQDHLAALVGEPDAVFELEPALDGSPASASPGRSRPFAYRLSRRFARKLWDYVVLSLPLIIAGLGAAGLAVAMLSADLLERLDVSPYVESVVDDHVLPLVDTLLGKDASVLTKTMAKAMVRTKSRALVDKALPPAKRLVYARGLTNLFVLEIGPLLTALLLAGRIGGSYAGEIATLAATDQANLLRTLGLSPRRFALAPAALAALLAAPLLTLAGTALALGLAAIVGARTFGGTHWFADHLTTALFPPLDLALSRDLLVWPPVHFFLKSLTFVILLLAAAEILATRPDLQPRHVPLAITASVVAASLSIILADWLFAHLLIRHHLSSSS